MKRLKSFTIVCILSLSLGMKCDPDYSPSEGEWCTILSKTVPKDIDDWSAQRVVALLKSNTCYCTDKRLPPGEQSYTKQIRYCRKYQAVSLEYYGILQKHYDGIINKLIECEAN